MVRNGSGLRAVVFDLDGVITFTANVHASAWKELFDDYLQKRAAELREPFRPFDETSDYLRYVDGKPREDGVVSFLQSRNIRVPLGDPSDGPSRVTVRNLGKRKDELFKQKLQQMGVDVDEDAVRFVRNLRSRGILTGLASSSRNTTLILEKTELKNLFGAVVDGLTSERLRLRGKPAPDIFLQCLASLDDSITPHDAAVVEDAISGVEAGRHGGFRFVLGVDRQNTGDLKVHGADWVIRNFRQMTAAQFISMFESMSRAA
jgi:trehalose 6-phosphate phosphatase